MAIYEVSGTPVFDVMADIIVCPIAFNGLTDMAITEGFEAYCPEMTDLIHDANQKNHITEGMLLCSQLNHAGRIQYVVGMPIKPHFKEAVRASYVNKGMRSLYALIKELEAESIALSLATFCEEELSEDDNIIPYTHNALMADILALKDRLEIAGHDITITLIN